LKKKLINNYKAAYIAPVIYPNPTAHALQTIQMAAAYAKQTTDAYLFVHDLTESENKIKEQYNVLESPFHILRLYTKQWSSRVFQKAKLRSICYNSAVAVILLLHPKWWRTSGEKRVIIVRSRLEILYWGLLRSYLWWLRDWILICEIHSLDLPLTNGVYDFTSSRAKKFIRALRNYNFVFSPMKGLAKAIHNMTGGEVEPVVLHHGTGLMRHATSPVVKLKPKAVLLGYIGTVDLLRGIDCILKALLFLPEWIQLRIIGRINKGDIQSKPAWLSELLNDADIVSKVELCSPVPYKDVATEIDACDIVIQPAGLNLHASRYASPLKLFDYMARGKPIVAAGVASHLEFLKDKVNARIYKPGDPQDLARCVKELIENPQQAQRLAQKAWEQSANYTYDARVRRIFALVERVEKRYQK